MKKFLLVILFLLSNHILAEESEITSWFNQESKQFLEIMNNSDGDDHQNFDQYQKFVESNFALKSIAYGLINEKIINNSKKETLDLYQKKFKKYLTKTIYNLATSNTSGEIFLKDIDVKDKIYIINSDITDGRSSVSLYWKVAKINDNYKILDVIVENTSYFVTKKSEFAKILRKNKNDLNALLKELDDI